MSDRGKPSPRKLATAFFSGLVCLVAVRSASADAPVADAMEARDVDRVPSLLDEGADVNAAQADGMTALHWAVYHDDAATAKLLVDRGADANARNRYGIPVLSVACMNGDGGTVRLLLDHGADANAAIAGGETVLMTAARTGRIGAVKALIAAGADVNAKERKRQTAVMWASAEGHTEVVQALLDAGAEFQTPLDSGFTPLLFAVREGHTETARVLLSAGADVNGEMRPRNGNRRDRSTPLILAVENGHFETALAMLEAGADPNAAPAGYTALHAITWTRRPLKGDTNPAPIGSGNLSSLDFVRCLAEHGADLNARYEHGSSGNAAFCTDGSTTFLMAARNSDLALLRLLLELGADWRIPNTDNYTPLLAAAGVGALGSGDEIPGTEDESIETVLMLLGMGADINAVTDRGETAMHGAAYHERPKLIHVLAERGADAAVWNAQNKNGWTPLTIARGFRPGNFRPSPKTIVAMEEVMRAAGVEIPPEMPPKDNNEEYTKDR